MVNGRKSYVAFIGGTSAIFAETICSTFSRPFGHHLGRNFLRTAITKNRYSLQLNREVVIINCQAAARHVEKQISAFKRARRHLCNNPNSSGDLSSPILDHLRQL